MAVKLRLAPTRVLEPARELWAPRSVGPATERHPEVIDPTARLAIAGTVIAVGACYLFLAWLLWAGLGLLVNAAVHRDLPGRHLSLGGVALILGVALVSAVVATVAGRSALRRRARADGLIP